MDNFDLKKYLANNILLKESTQDLINKEIKRLGLSPEDVEVIMKEGEEQLDEGLKDKITNLKSAMTKVLLVCSIVGGAASCQKTNPHVYKYSFHIDKLVTYTLKQDANVGNNLKLDAGQEFGIMNGDVYNTNNNSRLPEHMQKEIFDFIKNNPNLFTNNSAQQYNPKEEVGSFFFLEKDKLSDLDLKKMEDKLAAQEKAKSTGKDYTTTGVDTLEYMGQSKRGDIATK